ncbi:tight adherence protein B [Microlunatus sagamiharensis]|uniref:Tight adherence protein B n=1 Tax=Microlunatus sagamiharensis TaxID=546874 RepID=A0A1H2NF13_9ACTN|nr:type II secretion system F family protein [Microlunatus sagamiharensis]SDV03954.1 tight adherence protein B [Microlunatus sagamiharensis]
MSGSLAAVLPLLTLVLAMVTVLLAVPPAPQGVASARLSSRAVDPVGPAPRRRSAPALAVATSVVVVATGTFAGGARGAVLAAALVVAAGTVTRVALAHAADGRARRAQADVARACGVLASYVRVGQVPADALVLVARDTPVLAEAAAVQQIGGDVPDALHARAARPGHGGLSDLARAWRVSSSTGAPMAPALEEVAAGLASDESLRSVVSAELSAPRSTGKVMAVLPLVGIGLGYLLGGRPLDWLVAGPLGWACLLLGLLLAAGGVLWIERLARAAAAGT